MAIIQAGGRDDRDQRSGSGAGDSGSTVGTVAYKRRGIQRKHMCGLCDSNAISQEQQG